MTRKAQITIHSIQMQAGQREEMHFQYEGRYFQRGGYHYVLYDENDEDSRKPIKNRLKFSEQSMTVS